MMPNGTTFLLQVKENLVSGCWWNCQPVQPCQAKAHLHIVEALRCPQKCDKKLWPLLCLGGWWGVIFLLSVCRNKRIHWCAYAEKQQEYVWKLFTFLLSCLPQIEDSDHVYSVVFAKFLIIPSFPEPLLLQKAGSCKMTLLFVRV